MSDETKIQRTVGESPKGTTPPAASCIVVIFGASGDLTKRLLMPAFYNLACDGLLPKQFAIVGTALEPLTTEQFRARMTDDIKKFNTRKTFDERVWTDLVSRLHYTPGNFGDQDSYLRLAEVVKKLDTEQQAEGNVLFYMAVPPSIFGMISEHIDKAGFKKREKGWNRIIVEKPFGHDLPSAIELNRTLLAHWRRIADLPDRPLPRQGDGAEPPRLPLLQRHLRAALEQEPRRPHPVHGRRDGRRRGPRQILRPDRRPARHDPEPHVPDAGLPLHGAAGLVQARRRPQREGRSSSKRCAS